MVLPSKTKCIGILTSGGDCPGLNAAIRGVAKTAISQYGMRVIGVLDGFRGLVENRTIDLNDRAVSGILTQGGTILGTSRDKPYRMRMGNRVMDMTSTAAENAKRLGIDCLVCLGGGGTQKNALHMHKHGGLNVLTLPKTIDNDVFGTDISFGFDTAMSIATEAIDRLHTTATSHSRIIVVEVMGHHTGWLALGAGIAGGADVILIPEIPYDANRVAEHLLERKRSGKRFSIIAVAEAARSIEDVAALKKTSKKSKKKHKNAVLPEDLEGTVIQTDVPSVSLVQEPKASRLARLLQQLTDIEARVTFLGHVQRGGIPTATDRLLCTRMGTQAAKLLAEGTYNVMVSVRKGRCAYVPLEEVAGKKKEVPLDHPWIQSAKDVGTCLGGP